MKQSRIGLGVVTMLKYICRCMHVRFSVVFSKQSLSNA